MTGINGTAYIMDSTALGSGGEGSIYRAFVTRVAKVYKPDIMTQELENKLKIMINNPPNESVLSQVAWPMDLIYDENKKCVGFVMRELSVNAELGDVYKYPSTLPISFHQKINIAQNICVVISEVHKAGYIFGDFNPRNIGLDRDTGLVSFLDTDTYHVIDPDEGITYRCNVCAPGYAAPELLTKCSDYIVINPDARRNVYAQAPLPTFTRETDNFALAIHIFKLLMNGYTPFGGIAEAASVSQSSPGVGDAAVRRDSYCFKPGYKPQSAAIPPLDAFPQELEDLFARAFILGRNDPTQRPIASEWHSALSRYSKTLVTCPDNALHQYDAKNETCPYCEADKRFMEIVSDRAIFVTDIKQTPHPPPPIVLPSQIQASQTNQPNPTAQASQTNQATNPANAPAPPVVISPIQTISKTPLGIVSAMKNEIISAGMLHSVVVDSNRCLWAWGSNKYGQLGDAEGFNQSNSPIEIMENVVAVSAGGFHTMALTARGDLWAWGSNKYGQLGDGTVNNHQKPAKILANIAAVSAGNNHTLALGNNGDLVTWGNNDRGQLGDGTFEHRIKPVKIMHSVRYIAAGSTESAAITEEGKLLLWGAHEYGPTDAYTNPSLPMQVMHDVVSVSLGQYHAIALTTDGGLWAWGQNFDGQLGYISTVTNALPIRIMDNVVAISAGEGHSMAITADGRLWAWGRNNHGQLGIGTTENQFTPVEIMEDVIAVSAGKTHTLAITSNGTLWAWGDNKPGKSGDGTMIPDFWKSFDPLNIMVNMGGFI